MHWFGCLWRPSFTEYRPDDTIERDTNRGPVSVPVRMQPTNLGLRGSASSADVAQLVEQLIRNQQVIGSSPIVGSI